MRPPLPPTVVGTINHQNRQIASVQRQGQVPAATPKLNAQIRFHRPTHRLFEDVGSGASVTKAQGDYNPSPNQYQQFHTIGIESDMFEVPDNITIQELHLNGPWLDTMRRDFLLSPFHNAQTHVLVQVVTAKPATTDPVSRDPGNFQDPPPPVYPNLQVVYEAVVPVPAGRQKIILKLPNILIRRSDVVSVWRYPRVVIGDNLFAHPKDIAPFNWRGYDFDCDHYALVGTSRQPISVDVPKAYQRIEYTNLTF
jgi:hypothetical protein